MKYVKVCNAVPVECFSLCEMYSVTNIPVWHLSCKYGILVCHSEVHMWEK